MTTLTPAYTIRFDAKEETYRYDVLDTDGEVLDSFETRAEARADVRERLAADRAERDEEEAAGLRAAIAERLEDLGLDALRALAKRLGA